MRHRFVSLYYYNNDSLVRLLRKDCQHVLFSATYSEAVMEFARKGLTLNTFRIIMSLPPSLLVISEPNIIHLKRSEESLDNIKQYYVWCTAGDEGKFTALTNLYGVLTIGQCIVFCHVS